jgi:hypothetical protein
MHLDGASLIAENFVASIRGAIMNSNTAPESDVVEVILKTLQQAEEPLTLNYIHRSLRGPYRLCEEELRKLLQEQVAAARIFRFSPYKSKSPRFWHRDADTYARMSIVRVLNAGALKQLELEAKLSKRLADCPKTRRREILQQVLDEGQVVELPCLPGSRTVRYSVHRPDPRDYLRRLIGDFVRKIEQQSDRLLAVGVSQEATLAAARELLRGTPLVLAETSPYSVEITLPTRISPDPASPGVISVSSRSCCEQQQNTDEQILQKLAEFNQDHRRGGLISLGDLRQALKHHFSEKQSFDTAVLRLSRAGRVALYRHDYPSSLSEADRQAMATDSQGNYYNGISLRA